MLYTGVHRMPQRELTGVELLASPHFPSGKPCRGALLFYRRKAFKKVLGKLSANSWAKGHLAGTKGTLSRQTQDCAHGDEAVHSGAP